MSKKKDARPIAEQIADLLGRSPEPLGPVQAAKALGLWQGSCSYALDRMLERGQVAKVQEHPARFVLAQEPPKSTRTVTPRPKAAQAGTAKRGPSTGKAKRTRTPKAAA